MPVNDRVIHASQWTPGWATSSLFGIDLDVAAGGVVALLGGNGSGKTTLLRTLLGLVPHQSGTIELFGRELARFHDWSRIGYVPQRGRLQVSGATVDEVVMLGRLARRKLFRLPGRADREACDKALQRVGLAGFGRRTMSQLSGGQQQRAMIARALAGQADLLVLDEPLAALDVRTQTSLARLLGRLHADGLTILVVLHELGAMEPLLTRSVVQLGRVIHDGPLVSALRWMTAWHPRPTRTTRRSWHRNWLPSPRRTDVGLLAFDFMVRALVAGALTGVMAPAVGTYIVQRRLSLLGDGLGHVAIAGVACALLTGQAPVPVAIVVTVAGAVAIELLRQSAARPATWGWPSSSTAGWPPAS